MLVWLNTRRKPTPPPWLAGDEEVHRWATMATLDQGTLWCAVKYAEKLGFRHDAEWVDIGGDWKAALYSPLEPEEYTRDLNDALVIDVVDVTGIRWHIPALLDLEGRPAIGMRNRVVTAEDGSLEIQRDPATPRMAEAIQAAQEARTHAEADWEGCDTMTMVAWLLPILAAVYHIDVGTLGRLGLVGDVLLAKGLKRACGMLLEDDVPLIEEAIRCNA